jgi:rubredoxin
MLVKIIAVSMLLAGIALAQDKPSLWKCTNCGTQYPIRRETAPTTRCTTCGGTRYEPVPAQPKYR